MANSGIFSGQHYEQNQIHYLYLDVNLVDVPSTNGEALSIGFLPAGSAICQAYSVTLGEAAAPNSGAQLQIGFRNREGMADDTDGIKAGFTPSVGSSSKSVQQSSTALFFRTPGEVTLSRGATAFTAGRVRVTVEYTVPNKEP